MPISVNAVVPLGLLYFDFNRHLHIIEEIMNVIKNFSVFISFIRLYCMKYFLLNVFDLTAIYTITYHATMKKGSLVLDEVLEVAVAER